MPDFTHERMWTGPVAGIDEVGRGPLAGPVVACAAIVDADRLDPAVLLALDDSKKLPAARRAALYAHLVEATDHALGMATVEEIDTINILQASLLAMRRAMAGLRTTPVAALIDGNQDAGLDVESMTIVGGDSRSASIAAASIIAKVTRDRMMADLAGAFPPYGWERNAGYGVTAHRVAIETHGVTIHHRRSFAPIARLLADRPTHIWRSPK